MLLVHSIFTVTEFITLQLLFRRGNMVLQSDEEFSDQGKPKSDWRLAAIVEVNWGKNWKWKENYERDTITEYACVFARVFHEMRSFRLKATNSARKVYELINLFDKSVSWIRFHSLITSSYRLSFHFLIQSFPLKLYINISNLPD